MQVVKWTGQGEGTLLYPFILEVENDFVITSPFNIKITQNYVGSQNKENYFKFDNSLTIYLLSYMVSNRDSFLYFESKHAIKVTLFLTNNSDIIDGPYMITTQEGIQYIVKQQVFDPTMDDCPDFINTVTMDYVPTTTH